MSLQAVSPAAGQVTRLEPVGGAADPESRLKAWFQGGDDGDGDGRPDLDDPLPLNRDDNNVPDQGPPPA